MKVDPITDVKHIKSIKRLLHDSPRNKLLFIMGINSGLRVQDLLNLKIANVRYVNVGDRIVIREKKTGKENVLMINTEIKEALDDYLKTIEAKEENFLFKSRKGSNAPLTTYAVTMYVQQWCNALNLPGNYGAHSLRKSWCYHQRKTYGTSWEVIAKRLNHSSPSITRRYIDVKEEEVEEVLMKSI